MRFKTYLQCTKSFDFDFLVLSGNCETAQIKGKLIAKLQHVLSALHACVNFVTAGDYVFTNFIANNRNFHLHISSTPFVPLESFMRSHLCYAIKLISKRSCRGKQ